MRPISSWFLIIFGVILASVSVMGSSKENSINTRYEPIARNIDSKNIKACTVSKPLTLVSKILSDTELYNTGTSIQTSNEFGKISNATAGPLGDSAYDYVSFNYNWVINPSDGFTGTTIDNKRFQYEVRMLYKNRKYKTIEEALQHSNGFLELVFLYNSCSTPFKGLLQISKIIQELPVPKSSKQVLLHTQINGVNFINEKSSYFWYKGEMLDKTSNKRYTCSTVIVFKPNKKSCITQAFISQTFGNLKNSAGQTLTHTLTHDPSELRASLCYSILTTEVTP